jgi:hypothetical protein
MEDNQKKYLDKVISLLVRDTVFDYEKEKVYTSFSPPLFPSFLSSSFFFSLFYKYCEHTYGIVYTEIDYVWYQYRNIIKDKLRNNER